jgi:sialic acid synthase SpsE
MRSNHEIVDIQGRQVGPGQPSFLVAEIGANHNGDLETAIEMIRKARQAGADAVKLQSFLAGELVVRSHPEYPDLKKTEMPRAWYEPLVETARAEGIMLFSTATNEITMGWMEELNFPCYKFASAHITHLPLIRHAARLGKPMILSTGFSTMEEIEAAVRSARQEGNEQIILLHCVSNYPVLPKEVNLRFMDTLRDTFVCPVGFSDHTIGVSVPLAAVALGACIIEKHLTLDKSAEGEDHAISLGPEEFRSLIQAVRDVEASLGKKDKVISEREQQDALMSRRSLHAACDIDKGAVLTEKMISILRPGDGLPPDEIEQVVGKIVNRCLKEQEPITPDIFVPH